MTFNQFILTVLAVIVGELTIRLVVFLVGGHI
jgi:hypothetical protein